MAIGCSVRLETAVDGHFVMHEKLEKKHDATAKNACKALIGLSDAVIWIIMQRL